MARDRWWTNLPSEILAEEKADTTAKLWGDRQRSVAAKAWADSARQQAQELFKGFEAIQPQQFEDLTKSPDEGPYPGSLPPTTREPESPSLLDTAGELIGGIGPGIRAMKKENDDRIWGSPEAQQRVTEAERRGMLPAEEDVQAAKGGDTVDIAMGVSGGGLAKVGRRAVGAVTAKLAGAVKVNESMGQAVSPAEAAIRKMYLEPEKLPGDVTGSGTVERVRREVVRALTDERVPLNKLVDEARAVIARPLTSAEEVGEIVRKNSGMAAAQRAKEELRPVFETVRKVIGPEGPVLLRTFLTAQDNVDKAAAIGRKAGAAAEAGRKFSGDVDVAASHRVRQDILARLTPEQADALEAAAQKVWDIPHDILRRKVTDGRGIYSQEYVDDLIEKFPHYTPVEIVDYIPPNGTKAGRGGKIGLSTQDIRRLTEEGTAKGRRDPIESVVDLMFRAEADINANAAFRGLLDLKEQAPEIGRFFKQVPADYKAKTGRGEEVLEGYVDGEKVRYAVPYDLHQAVTLAKTKGELSWAPMQTFMSVWKNLVTGANATFIAANAPLDAMTYVIRQASREGGPQHIPSIAKSWMQAAGEVFDGLGKGEFRGKAAEYLKEGGGVMGMAQRTPGEVTKFTQGLDRPNPFTIRNAGDIPRIAKYILTLQPVQAVAERVEMIPRTASFNRAQEAGKRTQAAMIEGRDVTLDFQRAGTVTRVLNSYIPFFNVATQSGANVARTISENPKGAAYTIGAAVATPTLLTELWNRSDPDRERAYEDVPDYIKRRSLVVMLPFTPGSDDRGNPRPPFVEIRLREMMSIAAPLREATARVLGDDGDGMKEMALTMLANVTPLNYSDVGEIPFEFLGPGVGTAAQLAVDKDTFRMRPIATEYADENAAEISKMAARVLGGRPSQWEFAAKNLLGTYAQMGLPASNLLAGRPRRETGALQDIPVAGGLLRKMGGVVGGIGAETGQRLADVREKRALPEDVQAALAEADIRYDPSPVASNIGDTTLTRDQQERLQALVNDLVTKAARSVVTAPGWKTATKERREDILGAKVREARSLARERFVDSERTRRKAS